MKVSEFIEWLKTQDQDADVMVGVSITYPWQYEQQSEFRYDNFNPQEHAEYIDFRNNSLVPSNAPHKNDRTLYIGCER